MAGLPLLQKSGPLGKVLVSALADRHPALLSSASLEGDPDAFSVGAKRAEIERIDAAVRKIKVPLDFSDQFYDLRLHIDLIRQRLAEVQGHLGRSSAPIA
jgi:hypothetical protein